MSLILENNRARFTGIIYKAKMKKNLIIITILLMLASCGKKESVKIKKDEFSEKLGRLFTALEEKDNKKTIAALNELNQNDLADKFSRNFKEFQEDQNTIKLINKELKNKNLEKAISLLDSRIRERGKTPELSKIQDSLNAAQDIAHYVKNSPYTDAIEANRAVAKVKFIGRKEFKDNPVFESWLKEEVKKAQALSRKENEIIINSIRFISDISAISKGNNDKIPMLLAASISPDSPEAKYLSGENNHHYYKNQMNKIKEGKIGSIKSSLKSQYDISSFVIKIYHDAYMGKSAHVIMGISELEEVLDLKEDLKTNIMKELLRKKGYNRFSYINRPIMDFSGLI